MSAFLDLQGVEMRYRTRKRDLVALDGIDLQIERDTFVALIGPSGCGKTTVLNIIAGFVQPTSGVRILDGAAIVGPGPDRGIVFQHHALLPWMTVGQNLRFAIESARGFRDRKAADIRIHALLETVRLEHAIDRYPHELSGGMKQRVGIARALIVEPKLLLLDEPFGALDALTRAHLQDELLDLWTRGKQTALMITHDIEEALLLADVVAVMSPGPRATVAQVFDVPFPRPRRRHDILASPGFAPLVTQLLAILTEHQALRTA